MQNHLRTHIGITLLAIVAVACGGGADASSEPATTTGGGETTTTTTVTEEPTASTGGVAEAQMQPTEGNDVAGTVRFEETPEGLAVQVDLTGLSPNSQHGFHVHETGDCSAPDASSAGGHYSPEGHPHALPESGQPQHAGDMGNLVADENGEVHHRIVIDSMSIDGEAPSVVGRAVIVHADPDDGGQPTGNAGARIACGVVDNAGASASL